MRAALLLLALAGTASAGTITADELEGLRKTGSTSVAPDDELAPSDWDQVVATLDVCITAKGKVKSAKVASSSGDSDFDAAAVATVKKTWRFRPYKHGKKAVAACAQVELHWAPPPPPPPPRVMTVTPQALEAQRLTGDPKILPDAAIEKEIAAAGKTRVVAAAKICIDTSGAVTVWKMLKGTGFDDYDRQIESTMRAWTYKPYQVNGVDTPVCTAVTLIYAP